MDSLLIIPGIVGSFLPSVIAFVKQRSWSQMTKKVVAIVVSAVAALVAYYAQEGSAAFDWQVLAVNFGVIYLFAQTTYASFWKGSAVNATLEATFGGPLDN